MTDDLRTRIAAVVVGELLGQAEARADYASYDFDPKKPTRNLVHLDTSIDPDSLADAVIRELKLREDRVGLLVRHVTEWQNSE